jgi:hypothetical protein
MVMSTNGETPKYISNRDLERELRAFRWEVRCLIMAALVLTDVVPISGITGAIWRSLPF